MSAKLMRVAQLEPQLPRDTPFQNVVRPEIATGRSEGRYVDSATGQSQESRAESRGRFRSAPIWHVRHQQRSFRLVRPLLVRVRRDEEYFFAENGTLALMGTGRNPEEALADFCVHLVHFHQYYTRLPPGKVAGEGQRLKRLFEGIFAEER